MSQLKEATPDEARRLTDRIKVAVEATWQLIQEAYLTRTWAVLGYESWDAYCAAEFPSSRMALPREERQEVVGSLREAGLSVRAIAAATGTPRETIRRDLERSTDPLSQENGSLDRRNVTGVNGKVYSRTPQTGRPTWSPPTPGDPAMFDEPEIVDAEIVDDRPATTQRPLRSEPVMLTLRTHKGEPVEYRKPASNATFNETKGEGISWAAWSWNPVTGCLHGCDYCYARSIANRWTDAYPAGFTPVFHHDEDGGYTRLDAPANTVIPERYRDDNHLSCKRGDCEICQYRRVFVCSMADLYGRWVPDEWIEQVHASMLASPAWQYILLTKFPGRYPGLKLPPGAWVGTSVDEQKRVRLAEDAFRQLGNDVVKWLSLEPLKEPLEFSDFSVFDWVVIGAQTQTMQPDGHVPAFDPDPEWVIRITAQAKEAGCRVHWKPNLRRSLWLNEYPGA